MLEAKKLKAAFIFILIFAFFVPFPASLRAAAAFEPDVRVYSEGIYMVNTDTDICVYKKNETTAMYPASVTKIMTCLVVLENVDNLDEYVEITYDATDEFWNNPDPNKNDASNAALEPGQTNITYRDCLYALMLASACEAANILAYSVGGTISAFIDMMNVRAAELGCVNTHFGNAHGLHQKDNYSCAYDMYLISKYALDTFPLFSEICSETSYEFPPNEWNPDGYVRATTNKLLLNTSDNPYYYEYASGIKTGSLDAIYDVDTGVWSEGISNLVSTAQKDGYSYMLVTLGAPYHDLETGTETRPYSFDDHLTLYRWAFSTFVYDIVLSVNDVVATVNVERGNNADSVQLKPVMDYRTLLPKTLDKSTIQRIITVFDDTITAPVEKGEVLGEIELKLGGEPLEIIRLISADAVELSQTAHMMEQMKNITDQLWFKICAVLLALLIIAAVVLHYVNKAKKRKLRGNRRNIKR